MFFDISLSSNNHKHEFGICSNISIQQLNIVCSILKDWLKHERTIDDSGQLGSEVSSMYDHTNLEGIFEDSEKFIVALNEMINVFHSSLIKGIAGKIKDISESKLFDYYEQKPMSVIEKVSDKRVNLRAKFFELVNYYSDSKNKDTNVGQIKYISYE